MLKYLDEDVAGAKSIGGDDQPEEPSFRVLKAEVLHAVRSEMAQRLTDLVFRRTELDMAGPGPHTDESLMSCAADVYCIYAPYFSRWYWSSGMGILLRFGIDRCTQCCSPDFGLTMSS